MAQLNLSLEAIDRSLAADSLAEFVRQAWPVVEPVTPLCWNWHLDVVCEYLEGVAGGDIRRLLINVCPRSGKSILVSILFPAWLWIRYPASRLVFASYSAALSIDLSVKRRSVIQSPWYQQRWGSRVVMASDQNMKSEFANTRSGRMIATSVDGSVTGRGGSYIICDDLINPAMAESELEREGAIRWFDETLGSRLDDKKTGRVVVIEQRTHQADLSGHLLAQGAWEHLSLPAEFEYRTTIVMPRSGREIVKEEGELLWPEREGRAELDAARLRLGDYAYQCQYLQSPVARGGNRFKREWFGTFRAMPERFDLLVQAWDTAFKTSETSDYSACVTIGQLDERGPNGDLPGLYLLHAWHGRVSFSELKRQAKQLARQYRPDAVVIEDAASGQSLLDELRIDTDLPIKPVKVAGDKLVRAAAAEPTISAGRVLLPEGAPWVQEFLREVTAFPAAAHDDWVDALVHAIIYLRAGAPELQNWRRWARDSKVMDVARKDSPEAAAAAFGMSVDEVDDLVGDYDAEAEDLMAYAERERARWDPDRQCPHCHRPIYPGMVMTNDGAGRQLHRECHLARQRAGLPV
jgi:predicted phage terminase large subunit-like protein